MFQKRFLNNVDSCLEYKRVSYTMVNTPCFGEAYLDIRNQSGCLPVTIFIKAGLYCILKETNFKIHVSHLAINGIRCNDIGVPFAIIAFV